MTVEFDDRRTADGVENAVVRGPCVRVCVERGGRCANPGMLSILIRGRCVASGGSSTSMDGPRWKIRDGSSCGPQAATGNCRGCVSAGSSIDRNDIGCRRDRRIGRRSVPHHTSAARAARSATSPTNSNAGERTACARSRLSGRASRVVTHDALFATSSRSRPVRRAWIRRTAVGDQALADPLRDRRRPCRRRASGRSRAKPAQSSPSFSPLAVRGDEAHRLRVIAMGEPECRRRRHRRVRR